MNFEDEHYVRIYTRDTKTWKRWGWEARCVFMALWRKLDKAGVLEDIEDPIEDVALMTELPVEVVAIGFPKLVESGTVKVVNGCLIGVNYIEGQTAKRSDRIRAQESRDRRRGMALLSQIVTDGHENESSVTDGDVSGRDVTTRDIVTERDVDDTVRDDASQIVTERHANPEQRHSTQYNAEQSKEEISSTPQLENPWKPDPLNLSRHRPDVQRVHERWKQIFGFKSHSLNVGANQFLADLIAERIHHTSEEKCMLMLSYAKNDGMVSGRDDEGRKHESIKYLFGESNAFDRILRDAEKAEKSKTTNSMMARYQEALSR